MNHKNSVKKILDFGGITIDGSKEYDIKVNNDSFYKRVLADGSLGLGESYMDGWWDCERIDLMIEKMINSNIREKVLNWRLLPGILSALILNVGNRSKAFNIGEKHYDAGNDLYEKMLDKRMVYTCAYWKNASSLDEAQEGKLDLICRKLGLKKGMKVLDIGCGWGSFAKYAAEKYQVEVVGVTVSKEQVKLAEKRCKGLPVKIRLQDYRDIDEKFDRIVSVGMFEHVGYKNYKAYMQVVSRCLKDDGLFLLHTIGGNSSKIKGEPWLDKYIFPGGMIPSIKQIGKSIEKKFVMEDFHNFGFDYYTTLMEWYKNFDSNWDKIKHNYNERFYRMWKFYLLLCAGGFKSRHLQLWQIVLSKKGVEGGYNSIR